MTTSTAKITATATAARKLRIADLHTDPAFSPRQRRDKLHILHLAKAIRSGGDLDPITVWMDPERDLLVILDGHYRASAYNHAKRKSIPAKLFEGDRRAARLEAARCNSKATHSWTTAECAQYAWQLVIEEAGSKREIAQAASVSVSSIGNMRKRLAEMTAAQQEPTGNWWADRNGKEPEGNRMEETDATREAQIKRLREDIGKVEAGFKAEYGRRPTAEELGVAMRWHLGLPRFRAMSSGGYVDDEDEFSDDPDAQPIAPLPVLPSEGDF